MILRQARDQTLGFSILVSTQRTSSGGLWYGFVLAALLPLYCFIGWEGAADLAEETNDPRSVTPFAMIRANYVSVAASLFMIIGFLIAIPNGIGALLGQPKNPLIYIFQSHFGAVAAGILQVMVFLAIFSCVLANMVVATRLTFALSRDKMLPGSGLPGRVNATTHTPIASIVLVAVVGIGINLLSAGIAANVVSIASVAYYFVYALTVRGAIYAHRKHLMPAHRPGDFSLGRWFVPVTVVALAYAAGVIVIALAPHEGHTAAMYLLGSRGRRGAVVPALPALADRRQVRGHLPPGGRGAGEVGRDDALIGDAVRGPGGQPADRRAHDRRVEPGSPYGLRRRIRGHPGPGGAAGQQEVHVDAGTGQVGGHDVGERVGRRAGRPVRREPPAAHRRLVDGDVDDLAASGFEHVRHDGPRDQEVAQDVGGEQVPKAVGADLPEARRFGHEVRIHGAHADAGVVDQHVDAAEGRQRAIHARRHGLLVADIHDQPRHEVADPAGGLLDALFGPAGQDDPGSGVGQRLAHGEAQSAGTSGDERADAVEDRRGWGVRRLGHAAEVTV